MNGSLGDLPSLQVKLPSSKQVTHSAAKWGRTTRRLVETVHSRVLWQWSDTINESMCVVALTPRTLHSPLQKTHPQACKWHHKDHGSLSLDLVFDTHSVSQSHDFLSSFINNWQWRLSNSKLIKTFMTETRYDAFSLWSPLGRIATEIPQDGHFLHEATRS